MQFETTDILGVPVAAVTGEQILAQCDAAVSENAQRIFAYANAHGLNLARHDPALNSVLQRANIVYPDGRGVVFAAAVLGKRLPATTALTRWIWNLAEHCERKSYRMFLLGGTESASSAAAAKLGARFPKLVLDRHHGYFSTGDTAELVKRINEFRPQILLVGLGMPKQELWIDQNRRALSANVFFPAGAAIDFAGGVRIPCPEWISRIGFEWLFRLVQEPRRLFGRYIFGNVAFVAAVLRQRVGSRRLPVKV